MREKVDCKSDIAPELKVITLRIEKVKENILSTTWKVYITNDNKGPFYEIWQDADTESIIYYNSNDAKPETVLMPLTAYPYGAKTISEIVLKDMIMRGFEEHIIIGNLPWDD